MAEEQVQGKKIPPPADFAANAHVKSMEQYNEMYSRSIEDPEGFWAEIAEQFEQYPARRNRTDRSPENLSFKFRSQCLAGLVGSRRVQFRPLCEGCDFRTDQTGVTKYVSPLLRHRNAPVSTCKRFHNRPRRALRRHD